MVRLTVFDQSPAVEGRGQAAAIQDSLALAQQAEAWGYHRYWVSEHHSNETLIGVAPEILAAAIAAQTSRIRVGTAGVLLPYYAPFKVAEQFRVLDAIAPGRIDLGIGRSPGGQGQADALAAALQPHGIEHGEALRQLVHWVWDEAGPPHGVRASPLGPTEPDVWVLGGSCNGAALAAKMGLPFAFNYSNNVLPDGVDAPLKLYRDAYAPSARFPEPILAVQVWALAAETASEAERLFTARQMWRIDIARGARRPLVSPEAFEVERFTDAEQAIIAAQHERHFVGAVSDVAARLTALVERYGIDDLVLNAWTFDPAARAESYRLLGQALGG